PPPLPELRGPLLVRVFDQSEGRNEVVARRLIPVGIARPSEYVEVTGATFRPAAPPGKNRLEVKLRAREGLRPPSCLAVLTFPRGQAGEPGPPRAGAVVGTVPPDGKEHVLYAEGLALSEGVEAQADFHVRID